MPIFDFKCKDCSFSKEHFVVSKSSKKTCPKCSSENYSADLPYFRINIPPVGKYEMDAKVNKDVKEIYQQIGKESAQQDSKTLENMFGTDVVKKTYYESDD